MQDTNGCCPITVNWVIEKVGYLFANMLLPQTLVSDSGLPTYMYMYMDTQMLLILDIGDKMLLALWDDASSDATGLFARSQKLAGTVEQVTSPLYINSSLFTLCNESLVKLYKIWIWHSNSSVWSTCFHSMNKIEIYSIIFFESSNYSIIIIRAD